MFMLKQISKYIGIIVITILVVCLLYVVVLGAKYYLDKWEMARKIDQFNQLVINMFKSDTYGGRTHWVSNTCWVVEKHF